MNRFIVTADALGVPSAQVPLSLVWNLAQYFPAEKMVVAYHHETNHVLVNFPGWDAPTVQHILDEIIAAPASVCEGLTAWPRLHSIDREMDFSATMNSTANTHEELQNSTSGSVLAQMRGLMAGMTPDQQDRLSQLVCNLKSTLAAERLCFRKLFEAAPDGYVATDFEGNIQHANQAMHQLLKVKAPHLEGQPMLMFFAPYSKALIQQRLRLLRSGICEIEPYTDMAAQLVLCDENHRTVSMRLIALKSDDAAHSTIRWLIRDMT